MTSTTKKLFSHVCNEDVFCKIHEEHSKNLYNFIYYKYGNTVDAGDKVQEAFIKLWELCKDVSPEKAKSFLFTIARNLSLNEIKHINIKLKYQKNAAGFKNNADKNNPEFILEEKQFLEKYQKALAGLTEAQRVAFLMNRAEGKKHKEIAEILGISKKAVEKRIYGALEKLRKDIKEIP